MLEGAEDIRGDDVPTTTAVHAPHLRSLLLRSSIVVTALALAILAVPLALYIKTTNTAEALSALEREATRVVALSPDDIPDLGPTTDSRVSIGLYDSNGQLLTGTGPQQDGDARGALGEGLTRFKQEDGMLAAYVPFDQVGGHRTTVRAVMAESIPRNQTYVAWLLLLLGCAVAFAVSGLVAIARSRRIARPFEQIADAARQMRAGDFAVRVGATGVREGDEAGWLLEEAAQEAAQRVHREIEMAQDANHQVRTPVAAARLTLESALAEPNPDLRAAAAQAVLQLDRAASAIEEVLSVRGDDLPLALLATVETVTGELRRRWDPFLRRAGRSLHLDAEPHALSLVVAEVPLREALDILVDNALLHGDGTVSIVVREVAGSVAVDVADEGSIMTGTSPDVLFARGSTTRDDGTVGGLGLSLARSLVERVGGRLVLVGVEPTTFTVFLPGAGNG